MRPVIAVTVDIASQAPHGRLYAKSYLNYSEAIWRCGGLPRMIAPLDCGEETEEFIQRSLIGVHGLIMPGGDDIDPSSFGQKFKHSPRFDPVLPERLSFDSQILKFAIAKSLPYLGVCYGAQLLALLQGGTLVQDIPNDFEVPPGKEALRHQCFEDGTDAQHDLEFIPETAIAGIFAGRSSIINSKHHQAIDQPGQEMQITAYAPDGIVEAIESTRKNWFCLGVQWHPERAGPGAAGDGTIQALIDAATKYRDFHDV